MSTITYRQTNTRLLDPPRGSSRQAVKEFCGVTAPPGGGPPRTQGTSYRETARQAYFNSRNSAMP